jgi:hypothetical protein
LVTEFADVTHDTATNFAGVPHSPAADLAAVFGQSAQKCQQSGPDPAGHLGLGAFSVAFGYIARIQGHAIQHPRRRP